MAVINMRTLSRETARVFDELEANPQTLLVTRDGRPFVRMTLVSPIEQALYDELIAEGIDPFAPVVVRDDLEPLPPAKPGEKSVSDYLMEDRDSYYNEP